MRQLLFQLLNHMAKLLRENLFGRLSNLIEENKLKNGIEYEYIIGNPVAYEKGCRYIDVDLNRSFKESENFDQHKNSFYEINRANFLVDEFGIDGSKPCQIAIDLHTTTANMGTSIVMYGRRSKDLSLIHI